MMLPLGPRAARPLALRWRASGRASRPRSQEGFVVLPKSLWSGA